MANLPNYLYIVASIFFIYGLKMLGKAHSARKGNMISAIGMLIAVVATLIMAELDIKWILVGAIIGSAIGAAAARLVKMTSMPEMVGLFNGFGGLASLLVGWAEYHRIATGGPSSLFTLVAIGATVLIGGITFSGSMIAYAKLAEKISGKPVLFKGQQLVNGALLLAAVAACVVLCLNPTSMYAAFIGMVVVSMVLGVLVTIPIGGADMPVVIALLNSYSGLAACAAGFVIMNNVLIVAGSLVGASGIILTSIMCRAMNRSLANVMFAGVGATAAGGKTFTGEAKTVSATDAYLMLEAASSVVFVPGYGMAVAQAQHVVKELGDLLEENGCEVSYCVHPVAGRMPGHMNVLLAEADVPYEQLVEPGDVNPTITNVDVAVVIGANDVVNPSAREEGTALYGMPIIDVDNARVCIVLKRSLKAGFAGVENPLFFAPNTRMLLGDAKASITSVVGEFKG
ncbi:MAG: NAD(P)(+) transhydrogenase (Re/Si-specific) subunit beta [Verrucomicrobia bacterium]|jgi:H+-translocating NAD(P) transhydrogenase subunit beta|nr:NAD(P)(+) transhydrogenase (Re/Si-specific) subunit beta [Verrucomicrobiota bacterium]MBT7068464.1 NAD(P)(+) transhydrogenase (Re/Si-specific) subunit beta [Verrucomicrobiota bacterium]MBT7699299.1 NAD(P)(+) transhydrogenase (Re/Si-specific) subunit beta [Verrucomicrobiota bacterium]